MDKLDLETEIMFLYICVPLLRCKNFPKAQILLPEGPSNTKQSKVVKHFPLHSLVLFQVCFHGQYDTK